MKNSADLGECYPPRPSASVDNTLLDLQNSPYPTLPHSAIANSHSQEVQETEISKFESPDLIFNLPCHVNKTHKTWRMSLPLT